MYKKLWNYMNVQIFMTSWQSSVWFNYVQFVFSFKLYECVQFWLYVWKALKLYEYANTYDYSVDRAAKFRYHFVFKMILVYISKPTKYIYSVSTDFICKKKNLRKEIKIKENREKMDKICYVEMPRLSL